ncbi:MAG: hypothetical protein KKA07_04990 [Bacteroidetes bacterium]|nr:hypothetical protein [Bacteroidota bacterium]MBU1718408.1 hypothetical protein [Bacteroidota bacterium]
MRVLFLWSLLFVISLRTSAQFDSLAIKNLVISPVSCDSTVTGVILSDDNAIKQSFIKYGFKKLSMDSIWNPTVTDICNLESCLDSSFWEPIMGIVLKHKKTLLDKVYPNDYFRQYIGLLNSNCEQLLYISFSYVKHPEMGEKLRFFCERGFVRLLGGGYSFFYIIINLKSMKIVEFESNW